jgi:hypothetical protein
MTREQFDVSRGDADTVHRVELRVDEHGPAIAQDASVVVINPIRVTPLPALGDIVSVRIENPSGERFEGALGLSVDGRTWPSRPSRAAGPFERVESVRARNPAPRYTVAWSLGDVTDGDARRAIAKSPPATFTRLSAFSEATALSVGEDGDANVNASHKLTVDDHVESPVRGASARALKLAYGFEPGWKFLRLRPAVEAAKTIEGRPTHLGLWVRGDGSGAPLRLRFADAAGQTFQPAGARVDFKGWRYVTIPMDGVEATHWGKGDGQVHYPIAWDTVLLVDNPSRQKLSGELWFAGLTLIE